MAQDIQKSATAYKLIFQLIASSDHITGLTGKAGSVVVSLSKNGAAGSAPAGAIAEVDATNLPGVYSIAGNATDSDTAGPLWIYAKDAASDPTAHLIANIIDPTIANYGVNAVKLNGQTITAAAGVTFPASVASPTNITAATGITVSTNSDKTGYSLTQSFPTNFSSLGISVGGHISNVDTLTTYTGDTPQTGDSYARIGAAGASLTGITGVTLAATQTGVTIPTVTNLTNAPTSGDLTAMMKTSVTTAATAATPTAAAVTGSVGSVTAGVTVTTNNDKSSYVLSATGSAALTESYAADGAAMTLNQAIYQIWAFLAEKNVAGTTLTAKKLDGATSAMTFTLDSSSAPTSITRAT